MGNETVTNCHQLKLHATDGIILEGHKFSGIFEFAEIYKSLFYINPHFVECQKDIQNSRLTLPESSMYPESLFSVDPCLKNLP